MQLIAPEYLLELDLAYQREMVNGEKKGLRKVVKRMVEAMAPHIDN